MELWRPDAAVWKGNVSWLKFELRRRYSYEQSRYGASVTGCRLEEGIKVVAPERSAFETSGQLFRKKRQLLSVLIP
jgi:hypothetical protein